MNNPFEDIKINHSENIIINIKHASIDDVEQVLPGYTKELYINDYSSCKLCWNCCHEFSNQSTCIPLKYLNNVFYIYGHFVPMNVVQDIYLIILMIKINGIYILY